MTIKNQLITFFSALILFITMSGCAIIGDIFKAGMWVGMFIVIAIVGVIIFIFVKLTSSNKNTDS